MNEIYDVVIVGSGPAGYTAGIYAARGGLRTALVTGSFDEGGALMNTTVVENFPGFSRGVMGPALMEEMKGQAERFGCELIDDLAVELKLEEKVKEVLLEDGGSIYGKTVILSMGAEHKKLGIPGEEQYGGEGVSYCATCDASFFQNSTVIVAGGGDSALEEAMFVSRFAKNVSIVHRRDSLRASQAMIDKLDKHPNVKIVWDTTIESIEGDGGKVTHAILRNKLNGKVSDRDVDGVFVAIGLTPRSELVKNQVELDDEGYVKTIGKSSLTNLPGVFACGDLVDNHYQQAITAAGSGCQAALDAQEYLDK